MTTFLKSKILQNSAIPCLPLIIIYVLSALPLTLNYLYGLQFITLLVWVPVLALFKMKLIPIKHFLVIFSTGLISSYLNCNTQNNHITNFTGYSDKYITIKGSVASVHFPNQTLQWNAGTPKFLLELSEISVKNKFRAAGGHIVIQNLKESFKFGDYLILKGRLSPVNKNNFFSYETYLRQQKISHTFYVDECTKESEAKGFKKLTLSLYEFRDKIISKATKGLSDSKHRRIVASIFFGYKGILDIKERDLFQKSGTAHLFAVSGLHVGIAASFIYFLIRIFRVRNQYIAFFLIPPLIVYVIMTGSPPSAIRALIMLSVWTIARSFLLPSTGLNNLAVSALLILIINPLDLFSLGFIYTFVITCSLVMSFEKSLHFFKTLNEKNTWKGNFSQQIPFLYKASMLLLCSFTASLASYGLNIAFNERIIPMAFVTNFFSSILAWLSFFIASISILEFRFLYIIQDMVMKTLLDLVEFGAIHWNTRSPSFTWIILYYIFLFNCFAAKKKKVLYYGVTACCLIVLAIPAPKNHIHLYLSSASNVPTLDISFEGKRYIINTTSNEAPFKLINENIDQVFFSDSKASHSWSLEKYLDHCQVKSIHTSSRHKAYLQKKFPGKLSNMEPIQTQSIKTHFVESEGGYTFRFQDRLPEGDALKIRIVNEKYGKCFVYINFRTFEKKIELQYQDRNFKKTFPLPNT